MAGISRRSFFQKFVPKAPPQKELEEETEGDVIKSTVLTKRTPPQELSCNKDKLTSSTKGLPTPKAQVLENCMTKQGFDCNLCQDACSNPDPAIFYSIRGFATVDPDKCKGCGDCLPSCVLIPKAIELTTLNENS